MIWLDYGIQRLDQSFCIFAWTERVGEFMYPLIELHHNVKHHRRNERPFLSDSLHGMRLDPCSLRLVQMKATEPGPRDARNPPMDADAQREMKEQKQLVKKLLKENNELTRRVCELQQKECRFELYKRGSEDSLRRVNSLKRCTLHPKQPQR